MVSKVRLIIGGLIIVGGIVTLAVLATNWNPLFAVFIGVAIIIVGAIIGGYGLGGGKGHSKDNMPNEIHIKDSSGKDHTYTKK